MHTKVGLSEHAYTGAPRGVAHVWPDNTEHPSQWDRTHWSFDDALKTRSKHVHVPISAQDALTMMENILSATQSVGKSVGKA